MCQADENMPLFSACLQKWH